MLICFNLLQNNLFGRRFFLLLVDSCQGSKEVDQHFVHEDDLVSDDRHDPHALHVHVLAVGKGETTLFFCLIDFVYQSKFKIHTRIPCIHIDSAIKQLVF